MRYQLTEDDLRQAEYAARKFSGCWWTGTSGTLASWLLLAVQQLKEGHSMEREIGSPAFFRILEEVADTHSRKSQDYGDGADPLANIRNGADAINVEAWRACLLRMSDKMQRLKSYCRNGSSKLDGPEDDLLDICSYAAIALVMYREHQAKQATKLPGPA